MAKTRLKIADRKDIFLYMTRVENLFINEFLPDAPGDYVKLYLFALMYAQYEEEIDTAVMARTLGLKEFEVEEAWDYWEARGLVRRSKDTGTIEFIRMVERFYGKNNSDGDVQSEGVAEGEKLTSGTEGDRIVTSAGIRALFERFQNVSGRTISRRETEKLADVVNLHGVSPEVVSYAIDYCADIENYSADYISKVALRWNEEGCEDADAVRALLARHSERNKAYREIFRAVGFSRLTTPADREIMDRWFDEMGFTLDEVLLACNATGGIREPSLKYVNKILENKMLKKGGIKQTASSGLKEEATSGGAKVSRKVLKDYYSHIRDEEEAAYAARIREACTNVPGIRELMERENELSMSFTELVTGKDGERRKLMREERQSLSESKKKMLEDAGYPADYLERRYRCNICKDSGYTDEGTICSCCRARADEAYMWNLEREKLD